MKILLISGHREDYNPSAVTGVEEGDLTIELVKLIADRLKGYAEVTAYPYERDMYQDNRNGCLKVNLRDYDYIFECHFNAFNNKANGTEILIHKDYKGGVSVEEGILRNIVALGFTNRGIVRRDDLLNMKTCLNLGVDYALLETCFFDNIEDMNRYKANKAKIADAVVAGIVKGFGLTRGLQATSLVNLPSEQIIETLAPLYVETMKTSGILASVRMAQLILESDLTRTELGQNANNLHGMKTILSGNTWGGSTWDQKTVYEKWTAEWDGTKYVNIVGKFRKYECVEDSVTDHTAYLSYAKDGDKLRYSGLKGCKDYRKAAQIIKDGDYATSPDYVEKLCLRIEKWNLTRFDVVEPEDDVWYRVQVGAYRNKDNAENALKQLKSAGFEGFIAESK